jgi:MFS family permease
MSSGTLATIKTLPRPAWALFAGAFVNRFGSFVVPFLTLYLTRSGYSAAQAGTVVSLYGVGSLAAAGVGGYLADRVGRRSSIAISMFASAAAMLFLWRAPWLPLIALCTGLAGLTSELYRPAAGALIADLVPSGQRVAGFALYRLAINSGIAVGTAAAGFLADRSFSLLFLGDAATSVVFGLVALVALPQHVAQHPATIAMPGTGNAPSSVMPLGLLDALWADRRLTVFLVASTLGSIVYFQSLSTLGLQVRAYGLPNAAYGALLALNGALILTLELALTSITQRLPPARVIAAGYLFTGLGFGLVALAHALPLLAVTVLLWTLGEMLASPIAAAYVADLAPAHLRGRYQGLWGLTSAAGLILAPALGTRIFSWSASGLWLVCGVLGILAAALVVISGETSRGSRS